MKVKKKAFIKMLAKFLVERQAEKSVFLEMKRPWAQEWAALRDLTPIFGYPSVEEAEKILEEFLG